MRRVSFIVILCIIITSVIPVYASKESVNTTKISINGEYVQFNDELGYPFIDENNRTQVPFRVTLEKFGAKVSWDGENNRAVAIKDGVRIEVPINKNYIICNGEKIENDTEALIKEGRTYLPIRVVMEAFGCEVGWHNESKTVLITSNSLDSYNVDPNSTILVEGLEVTINEACEYKLPQELNVTFGDNTTKQIPVKWDRDSIDTSIKGKFQVQGQLEGYNEEVAININIIDYVIEGSIKNYNKKESEHFIAYYTDNDLSIIDEVLSELEKNYTRIINDLKVQEMPKVELNIYPSLREYHKTLNPAWYPDGKIPNWSVGNANSDSEISIVSPINTGSSNKNYDSMLKVVVHEFTHSVSKVINPTIGQDARYLSEAIALYEADQFNDPSKYEYIKKGNYPTLEEISSRENTYEYNLGYVLIEYIVDKWGMDEVVDLIKEKGDIQKVLNITTEEFEKDWYKYIEDKYLKE